MDSNNNLQLLLSKDDVKEAILKISKKKYVKPVYCHDRYSQEQKELSKIGEFIEVNNLTQNKGLSDFYNKLNNFSFLPYKGISIKKSSGKLRPLLVPQPKDRIILAAILLKLSKKILPILSKEVVLGVGLNSKKNITNYEPEIKKTFKDMSVQINKGYSYVLKIDFKDFFSTIDRDILLNSLKKYINENSVLYKVVSDSLWNNIDAVRPDKFWGSFSSLDLKNKGVPQGLAYSPLLATFFSIPLDKSVSGKNYIVYRYIDDMIILCKSCDDAEKAYKKIQKTSKNLNLILHPLEEGSKTEIIDNNKDSFIFLGIEILKGNLYVPQKAINSFLDIFESEILNERIINEGQKFEHVLDAYRNYTKGWNNYYKICSANYDTVKKDLEKEIYKYIKKRKKINNFCGKNVFCLSKPYINLDI